MVFFQKPTVLHVFLTWDMVFLNQKHSLPFFGSLLHLFQSLFLISTCSVCDKMTNHAFFVDLLHSLKNYNTSFSCGIECVFLFRSILPHFAPNFFFPSHLFQVLCAVCLIHYHACCASFRRFAMSILPQLHNELSCEEQYDLNEFKPCIQHKIFKYYMFLFFSVIIHEVQ